MFTRLFFFFSSQDEILYLSFIPGWNFISAKTCKQSETFDHRQGWFHPRTSFIPGWNFTCKHPLKIHKWNIPTDRAQRVDEKNEVTCLVIMLIPRVMVINMSKMTAFCVLCWWQQKTSLSKIFKCIWNMLLSFFRKWYGWRWSYRCWDIGGRNIEKTAYSTKSRIFKGWYLGNVSSNPNNS